MNRAPTLCCPDLSCRFQAEFLDGSLAQDKLLHFPTARQRIGFDELEVAGNFLRANIALCSMHAVPPLWSAGLRLGKTYRQEFFAEEGIGDAEYLHVGYFGMADQELFDFAGEEIFATANNHIFQATHDIDIAACIHCRQVAGMQPAIAINGLCGLFRHVVVALHDDHAPAAYFAALSYRYNLASLGANDFDVGIRIRNAHRGRLEFKRIVW